MEKWYEFVCLNCGHGGMTQDPEGYRAGRYACPRCGSIEFEVEEPELAPLASEEDLSIEGD